jgi:hypothetical protein
MNFSTIAVMLDRIVVRRTDATRNEHVVFNRHVFNRHIVREPGVILHPDAIADSRIVYVTSDDGLMIEPCSDGVLLMDYFCCNPHTSPFPIKLATNSEWET